MFVFKKNYLILLCALLPTLCLGAADKPFAGTTLNWICSEQPATDAAKALLPEFEQQTGIKVNLDIMDEVRMLEKLELDKSSRTKLYDIVSIESTWIALFMKNQLIYPIDDLLMDSSLPVRGGDLNDFPEALIKEQCVRDGKTWMVPFGLGASMLAIRSDWLKDAGLSEPKTWPELLNVAKKMMKKDKDGKVVRYGISLRGLRGIHSAYIFYCISQPFGLEFMDSTMKPQLNSPQALNGLKMYLELAKYAPPGITTWTHEEAATAFNNGLAAMFLDNSTLLGWVERELHGKAKYIPIPKADGYPAVSSLSGWGLGVHADSDKKQAAIAFIEFMTSKRNAKKIFAAGGPAERISILTDPALKAKNPLFGYQLDRYKIAKFAWPRLVEIPEWNDIVGKYVTEALAGARTAESAQKAMNNELMKMMRDAGYFD